MTSVTAITRPALRWRHEDKHVICRADDMLLAWRLRKLFSHDANADANGSYWIRSLYFDTPADRALREKLDGVNEREKFRLRYYGADSSRVRLEKKLKRKSLVAKQTAWLDSSDVEQLLTGDLDFLLTHDNALLAEFYSKLKGQLLRPAVIVSYCREAFVYKPGNVRITLDRGVRRSRQFADFLALGRRLESCEEESPAPLHAADSVDVSEGFTILEVKYDAYLSDIVRLAVQSGHRMTQPHSKYAACRQLD